MENKPKRHSILDEEIIFPDSYEPKPIVDSIVLDASIITSSALKDLITQLAQKGLKMIITSQTLKDFRDGLKDSEHPEVAKNIQTLLSKVVEFDSLVEVKPIPDLYETATDNIISYCIQHRNCGIVSSNEMMILEAKLYEIACCFVQTNLTFVNLPFASPSKKLAKETTASKEKQAKAETAPKASPKKADNVLKTSNQLPFITLEGDKAFIDVSKFSVTDRKYLFRQNFSEQVDLTHDIKVPLVDYDEIIHLHRKDNNICFVHFRFHLHHKKEYNAYYIESKKYSMDTDFTQEDSIPAPVRPVLAEYQSDMNAVLNHTSYATHVCMGKHCVTPTESENYRLYVFSENDEAYPLGQKVELSVGDKLLRLRLAEEGTIKLFYGKITEVSGRIIQVESLVQYDRISFDDAYHSIVLDDTTADKYLKRALKTFAPPLEEWITIPGCFMRNGNLYTKIGLFEDNTEYDCLNLNGDLVDTGEEAKVDLCSIVIHVMKQEGNIWRILPYGVKAIRDIQNGFLYKEFDIDLSADKINNLSFYAKIIASLRAALKKAEEIQKETSQAIEQPITMPTVIVSPETASEGEIASMPSTVYSVKERALYANLGASSHTATVLLGDETASDPASSGRRVKLAVGDHLRVLVSVGGNYTLSEYTITKIAETNNAIKQQIATGWVNEETFQHTENAEIDSFLTTYLSLLEAKGSR